ncbi:polysaccharide deacetylase family protein [Streptomyces sp. NPDC003996]
MTSTDPLPKPTKPASPPPGPAGGVRQSGRGLAHWPVRFALGLLALAVLALPFHAADRYYLYQKYMSPQVKLSDMHLSPDAPARWSRAGRHLPATSAPVVLAYHGIGPRPGPFVVTPRVFDQQLSALQAAGYHSLTTNEFLDYLNGGPVSPRSVYLTFDDGPDGLWVYGDRILARHHMHGAVFLTTGRVDHDRPHNLSWNEIKRMAHSGRWDFQDHTHDLHRRAVIDAAGHKASALSNRLWLKDRNRLETPAEYHSRITADIGQSVDDITAHGLPAPRLFAFPSTEATERATIPGQTLKDLLSTYFTATLTDVSARPLTASRRAAAAHQVQRLAVTGSTTPGQLLTRIAPWVQVAPPANLLDRPDLWTRHDGTRQSGLGPFVGAGPFPAHAPHVAADYRRTSSLDWTDYQLDATIQGLGDGTNQASVTVRNDSLDPVTVTVSRGRLTLAHDGHKVATRPLAPAASHTIHVTLSGATTTVQADNATSVSWTSHGSSGDLTGGVGIRTGIKQAKAPWPSFTALRVSCKAPQRDAHRAFDHHQTTRV